MTLQEVDGKIVEMSSDLCGALNSEQLRSVAQTYLDIWEKTKDSVCLDHGYFPNVYWNSLPVICYTDKTRKAIDVVKFLNDNGLVVVNRNELFTELVEKIAGIL